MIMAAWPDQRGLFSQSQRKDTVLDVAKELSPQFTSGKSVILIEHIEPPMFLLIV